jgi:hypothetical protein
VHNRHLIAATTDLSELGSGLSHHFELGFRRRRCSCFLQRVSSEGNNNFCGSHDCISPFLRIPQGFFQKETTKKTFFPWGFQSRNASYYKLNTTFCSILRVFPYATGETPVESDEPLESCFAIMKAKGTQDPRWIPAEYAYWKERGMLEMDSFADLLRRLVH